MKVKPGPIQKSGRPLKCLQSVLLTAEDNAAYSAASLTDCVVSGCASVPPPPSPPPSLLLPVMSVRQEAGRQAGSARSATCTAAGRGRPPPPPSPPPPPPPRRRARARARPHRKVLSLSLAGSAASAGSLEAGRRRLRLGEAAPPAAPSASVLSSLLARSHGGIVDRWPRRGRVLTYGIGSATRRRRDDDCARA